MKISSLKNNLKRAAEKGWFGRRAQVEALIPYGKAEKHMTKEERLACITRFNQKYPDCSEVRLHFIWSSRIGEFISRCIHAAIDCDADIPNHIVHVFIEARKICNRRLLTIMGRRLTFIPYEDAGFWKCVLLRTEPGSKARLWKYYKQYALRKKDLIIPPEILENLIALSDEELAEAEEKMQRMGLRRPYVCISNRDQAYLNKNKPERDWNYHDFRNSKISACSKAAEYLKDQGLQTVRMGRDVEEKAEFSSCIDYANDYYDELLDIALPKFSKFFVCEDSGIMLLAYASGIPVALKNLILVNFESWGSIPQNDKGLFICKKLFLKSENRYMSIREMLGLRAGGDKSGNRAEFYLENGIEIVENTPEDIYDLVKEMNERLDGTWEETEESVRMQEQVQKLLYDDIIDTGKEYNACMHCKISITFLKHNLFLLG